MSTYPPHELSCSSAPVCRRLYDTITRLHAEIAEQKIGKARLSQRLKEHEEHLSATVSVPVLEAHEREKAAEQA